MLPTLLLARGWADLFLLVHAPGQAQAPTGGGGGVDLGNLWGLGVIAVALVVGQIITFRYVVQPERARGDRLEAELIRVNTAMADKFAPALDAARRAVERREGNRERSSRRAE